METSCLLIFPQQQIKDEDITSKTRQSHTNILVWSLNQQIENMPAFNYALQTNTYIRRVILSSAMSPLPKQKKKIPKIVDNFKGFIHWETKQQKSINDIVADSETLPKDQRRTNLTKVIITNHLKTDLKIIQHKRKTHGRCSGQACHAPKHPGLASKTPVPKFRSGAPTSPSFLRKWKRKMPQITMSREKKKQDNPYRKTKP